MNILYDGPFTPYPKGGVVRYYNELSVNLLKQNHIYFSRYYSRETKSKDLILPPLAHFRPHKLSFYFEYLCFKFFHKNKIDIVHPTEFELSPTGSYYIKKGAKLVITIHDLIHEKFGAPHGLYDKKSRTYFYEKADGYIFVSASTQNDFRDLYTDLLATRPSQVIWHGNHYQKYNLGSEKNSNQFLFVGSRRGYKNFSIAAKAFSEIANVDSKVRLIIVGAPPYPDELELLKKFKNQVDWKVFPSDKELIELYSSSLALLYTSNYEGFGFPIIEAMSQGCIPICGNHSSIPEVLGDCGVIYEPNCYMEITKAMKSLINNSDVAKIKSLNCVDRSQLFSWEKSAAAHLKFYQDMLNN